MNCEGIATDMKLARDCFGFGGRLTRAFPSQIIVDITEVCNLECVHCPHPEFKKSKYYAKRYLNPDLNKKMVHEVREAGAGLTQYIRYSSEGEPLIHPRGYEMIEYAALNSGVFVTLTTNGTIMNEKRTRRLLDSGVHMIDISIDAFSSEVYSKIRVNGELKQTRSNVLNLIRWNKELNSGTKVVVSFIEQPINSHEILAFQNFWKSEGADEVVIRRLHSAAGAVGDVANQMRLSQSGKGRRPCVYPWERVVLTPRGILAFCPADWTHGSSVMDYSETTISEVWRGEFYRALREAHLQNDFTCHQFCGQCPDWEQTRWPGEGRAYADLIAEFGQGSRDDTAL